MLLDDVRQLVCEQSIVLRVGCLERAQDHMLSRGVGECIKRQGTLGGLRAIMYSHAVQADSELILHR
ncbi:MAG: hypothetical protein QM695_16085 [Micropruina sp.]